MAENEPTEVAESRAEPEIIEPQSIETDSFERLDEKDHNGAQVLEDLAVAKFS